MFKKTIPYCIKLFLLFVCFTSPRFVASCYGGSINKDEQFTLRNELSLAQLRCQLNSNLIPIGLIKQGSFLQRALVFKVSSLLQVFNLHLDFFDATIHSWFRVNPTFSTYLYQ